MISKCGWKFGLPSFCLCNHCGMQSEGSCVAWAKLLLSVMRTYLWVILGSWMLQGLCSFLLALRQGSPAHSDDGCLLKIALPLLLHIQVTSPPMGTSKLNPACAFIFYCMPPHLLLSFLSCPPFPFLLSSIFLPSPSCVQWGAKLFRGGEMDF